MKNGIKSLAVWLIIGVILAVGISAIYDNNDKKWKIEKIYSSKEFYDNYREIINVEQ